MLDHLSIQCVDFEAATHFYDTVLPTIGGSRIMDFGEVIGYGVGFQPTFWIGPTVPDPDGNNVEAVCHLPQP